VAVSHIEYNANNLGLNFIMRFLSMLDQNYLGHDVRFGNWSQINSHCTIAGGARGGSFVTIHPNSVVPSRAVICDGVTVATVSVVVG
jgi:UDP-3-O-[3-hydroxymyristoyl] glucosamine N-acyltransferase